MYDMKATFHEESIDMKNQEGKLSMVGALPSSNKDFMTSRKEGDQAAEGPTKKKLLMNERLPSSEGALIGP